MNSITKEKYEAFVNMRNELNELILKKSNEMCLIMNNRHPIGRCYDYDFESDENGNLIIQFESTKCQETDYDTFYLPLEFLFDESYHEKYKLIYAEEVRKKEEEKIKK